MAKRYDRYRKEYMSRQVSSVYALSNEAMLTEVAVRPLPDSRTVRLVPRKVLCRTPLPSLAQAYQSRGTCTYGREVHCRAPGRKVG